MRDDYETGVCARLAEGQAIPFEAVRTGGWRPAVADCHNNVDTWVRAHPGAKAIRGWITHASYSGGVTGLTAHSIVEDAAGRRFDITPLENERYRQGTRFIEHLGDDRSFFAMKELGLEIQCLGGKPAPKLDAAALLAGWSPTFDEEETLQ